jgi:hypothetical protein
MMLAVTVVLGLASLAAAQTGNEEAICRNDPNVFFCENFEDRPLGPVFTFFAVPIYKNNGWGVGDPNNPDVVNTERADGTKALRMTTPANAASGGSIDTTLLGGPYRTVYWRWYVKYSPNYVWSPIATKHNQILSDGGSDNGIFNFVNNLGIEQPVITFALSAQCVDQLDCWFPPNMNGGFPRFNLNQWYCVEARLTANTDASATDGYVQAWIDSGDGRGAVQYWEYPNVNLRRQDGFGALVNNSRFDGFYITSYWNCGADEACHGPQPPDFIDFTHPEIYRYMDAMIGSTARIGCLDTPPPPSGAPAPSLGTPPQPLETAPAASRPDTPDATVNANALPNVVNAQVVLDTDSFADVNGQPLAAYSANWPVFANWNQLDIQGSGFGPGIGGGQANRRDGPSWTDNQWAEIAVGNGVVGTYDELFVGLRATDAEPAGRGYGGGFTPSGYEIRRWDPDGTRTTLVADPAANDGRPGDVINVQIVGSTITLTVSRDGALVVTLSATDSLYLTGGTPMLWVCCGGATTQGFGHGGSWRAGWVTP